MRFVGAPEVYLRTHPSTDPAMPTRLFDLNVEDVLEHWEPPHAVREIIANALDEQVLTRTRPIDVYKDATAWCIRDFGRGLAIEHFTQKENAEKLDRTSSGVIGKFGVGLKDALSTFHRRGISVSIKSSRGLYTVRTAEKHNFEEIVTLHVEHDTAPTGLQGTEFRFQGLTDAHMEHAKSLFLAFSDETVFETTPFGQILMRPANGPARVYINGVLASEEDNFLFSYNVTSLTAAMRKRLNRERENVGRTLYVDRVKAILQSAEDPEVQALLAEQIETRAQGGRRDELHWIEISKLALTLLHARQKVAYVTEADLAGDPDLRTRMEGDDFTVIQVTDHELSKLQQQVDTGGPDVWTAQSFNRAFNESFEFRYVDPSCLSAEERNVWHMTPRLLDLVQSDHALPRPPVRISETMRPDEAGFQTAGVWNSAEGTIVIKRSELSSLPRYAGVLLHELAHAQFGYGDGTRDFEGVLTDYIGACAAEAVVSPARRPQPSDDSGARRRDVAARQEQGRWYTPVSLPDDVTIAALAHRFAGGVCVHCGKREDLASRFSWPCI